MKKILTLVLLVMAVGAGTARAQGGLNLNWDQCLGDGAVVDKTFACNTNSGGLAGGMYASLILPSDLTAFAATTVIIDIGFTAAVPDWWKTSTGECRQSAIAYSSDPGTITNGFASGCPDIWGGSAQVLSVFQPQPSTRGPEFMRLNGGAAIPAGTEIAYTADGTELVVAKISISRAKTVGTGACAGCSTGNAIVLNECLVQQPEPLPKYKITNEATRRWITWQGGGGVDPATVPTANRTWGSIKNMYK